MKQIFVINGPNLNMLGIREPAIYGHTTLDDINKEIKELGDRLGVACEFFQSNSEGALIDKIQSAYKNADGIIINPGAYTHYSYAIRDALASVDLPAIEVHLSDINSREEFRRHSVTKDVCREQISGLGKDGYLKALQILVEQYVD
ncbi:MAG: type II 3-dehydroquinate dehydratase [Ruminococcaceae bacterium]|nr:type II 3-dehydroquinate dehydratase [Oscillospiraceae bacterium]